MAKRSRVYGIGKPFQDVFPVPVLSARAPLATDKNFDIGQVWVDTSSNNIYMLAASAGGSASWYISASSSFSMPGDVLEIDAEYLYAAGTDLVITQSPVMQSNATTGVAPTGSAGDVNLMYLQDGCLMEQFILGAGQTIIAPRMTALGLDISLDATDNDGAEYNFGARANAKHAYTIGTSAAFAMEATIYVTDVSGCDPLVMGFRKVEANNATLASYTDYACIGLNQATSATNVAILTEVNAGGTTDTDTTDAWADTTAVKLKVLVSSAGVVTYEIDGAAPTVTAAFTFDDTDVVMPFIHFLNGADVAGPVNVSTLKIGLQA